MSKMSKMSTMSGRTLAVPLLALLALLAAAPAARAAEGPRPAAEALSDATRAAATGKKSVFVGFHASWCGWCKKLEKVLGSPGVKESFDARFESVWLTVQERGVRKASINPGAPELYRKWSGKDDVGLPFYAFLDGSGRLVTSSVEKPDGKRGENIGYPGEAPSLERFLEMVKRAAPGVTPAELDALRTAFAPKAP